jgi:hypothetical protein
MMRLNQNENPEGDNLAVQLLVFLANDPGRFAQFLSETGLGPGDFKSRLQDPAFQAMVLDHLLQDESLIIEFTASRGLKPGAILAARRKLPGFHDA